MAEKERKLTTKQQRFVEAYTGNATQAAIEAGYSKSTAKVIGCENLTKPYILDAIKNRAKPEQEKRIATREERQAFWSRVMDGTEPGSDKMSDRLKAAELLGRSEADFTDKIQGNLAISHEEALSQLE